MDSNIVHGFGSSQLLKAHELCYFFTEDLIAKVLDGVINLEYNDMEDWIETLSYKNIYQLSNIMDKGLEISIKMFD